ncbi:MAG: type II toxin-antitoxin system prevent-host-death family antitoxin [Nitrospira sp.]|nr:type II toxin-antitoxin system prevent-host-death family antitoxin [Nitrospira sp.]
MSQIDVRELKGRLGNYLKRVQGGEEFIVMERGRSVARIVPVKTLSLKRVLEPMLREGAVRWSGGKPRGASRRPVIRGQTLADTVRQERR